MILSAIGLPMPGQSIVTLPPPSSDRAEGVQSVAAAVAPGGASRPRDADTNSGSGAGRQSARDEARVIRLSGGTPGRAADRIAGPQPAFEIAVLEKLREDAMRVPPDSAEAPPAPVREQPESAASASDPAADPAPESAPRSASNAAPEVPGPARDAAPVAARDSARDAERAEPRDRTREPADEGFDDARRMSEERSPPRIDLTR